MRIKQLAGILFFLLFTIRSIFGQNSNQNLHVISFESGGELKAINALNSEINLSSDHFKHKKKSLKWQWDNGGQLQILQPIGYASTTQTDITSRIPVFVFWIYNEIPLPGKKLRFSFHTNEFKNCWFDFELNYTGWRAGWVAYDRDMEGEPQPDMNKLVIEAPDNTHGKVFLDHLILTAFTDSRFPMADNQLPLVNPNAWDHWLVLYKNSQNRFDIPISRDLSQSEQKSIDLIEKRVLKELITPGNINEKELDKIRLCYNRYKIHTSTNGVTGTPIWYSAHFQLYSLNEDNTLTKIEPSGLDLREYTTFMGYVARTYANATNNKAKDELKECFLNLTKHLFDQGFQDGSGTGTLTHSGYAVRNLYTSFFIMKDVLTEAGLLSKAQKTMEWLSGAAEVKQTPKAKGISADAFNTTAMGRLLSILMLPDTPVKAAYLKGFKRYIDNGLVFADGLEDFLKPDGSVFHHANLYPAYATGGFNGATQMVYLLSNSEFKISSQSHKNLKNALMMMRIYCNLKQWPLSLSARHPNGKGELNPLHYAVLALAGSPDGSEPIDRELAQAYLRLSRYDKPAEYKQSFLDKGFIPEQDPSGNWSMNYAALGIHRRADWQATARGHSRYLWSAEAYIGANYYGRYITYGHLQILGSGDPVSNRESGFQMEGWDWNRWPGTTTIHLPFDQLKAQIIKPCPRSGFEEMLLSDESYSGAISFNNRQGAFALNLHEHDKYNGSHRARKSIFFFENRIVCLGSDIENQVSEYPTETTLFQSFLSKAQDPILLNGEKIDAFPFSKKISKGGWKWVSDNQENHYFIHPDNEVLLLKQHQSSKHQATCEPTNGNFMSAVIEHGYAPKDESYEYFILVKSTPDDAKGFASALLSKNKPYEVLQKDKNAHIVWDRETNITAFLLFESGTNIGKKQLISSTAPCMIMICEANQQLTLSICDPDLHLYEGPADEVIIAGKRQERGVYSRDWYYNPAAPARISVTVKGNWSLAGNAQNCHISNREEGKTELTFMLQHGLSNQIELIKQ